MNKLIFFFVIVLLCSCSDEEATQTKTVSNNAPTKTVRAQLANNPLPQVQRDTTPKRTNYMVDTALPKSKIKAEFPFDIPMTTGEGKATNSEIALANNGKPTVVLFWLTTCYPCRIEMKAIKAAYPQWEKEADFNLVAISTDFPKNYERYLKMVKDSDWPWETYHDTNREYRNILPGALNGLPQSFVFDKNGEIVYHKRKYATGDEEKLFAVVKGLASK